MNKKEEGVRIDKWLWAVRIFKTRSQSTKECRRGKVLIGDIPVKPSRVIQEDEVITVKKLPVVYTYRIKKLLGKRISAKLVSEYVEDLTPEEEKNKLVRKEMSTLFIRKRGEGRPTKKERRTIERFKDSNDS
jgi:ribosome-associated heat shock protein Hsp15